MGGHKCYLCDAKSNKAKNICLFRFPLMTAGQYRSHHKSDIDRVHQLWFDACDLVFGRDVVNSVRICSKHFKSEDMLMNGRRLHYFAVPSIDVPNPQAAIDYQKERALKEEKAKEAQLQALEQEKNGASHEDVLPNAISQCQPVEQSSKDSTTTSSVNAALNASLQSEPLEDSIDLSVANYEEVLMVPYKDKTIEASEIETLSDENGTPKRRKISPGNENENKEKSSPKKRRDWRNRPRKMIDNSLTARLGELRKHGNVECPDSTPPEKETSTSEGLSFPEAERSCGTSDNVGMVDCRRMDSDHRACNVDVSQLCRICALQDEHVVPIFEGDGLELDFEIKLKNYLGLKVSRDDELPLHICLKCSNTLMAWHDLVIGYKKGDQRLRSMLIPDKENRLESDVVYIDDDSQSSVKIVESTFVENCTKILSTVLQASSDSVNRGNLLPVPATVGKSTSTNKARKITEISSQGHDTKNKDLGKIGLPSGTKKSTAISVENTKKIIKPLTLSPPKSIVVAKPQLESSVVESSPPPPVSNLPTTKVLQKNISNIIAVLVPYGVSPVKSNNVLFTVPVGKPNQSAPQTAWNLLPNHQNKAVLEVLNHKNTPLDSSEIVLSESKKELEDTSDTRGPSPCPSGTSSRNDENMEVETALTKIDSNGPSTSKSKIQQNGSKQTDEDATEKEESRCLIFEDHRYSKSAKTLPETKTKYGLKGNKRSVRKFLTSQKKKKDCRGCFVCGKLISNPTLLSTHERSHFKSLECISYNCSLCKESFKTFQEMFSHRKGHEQKSKEQKKKKAMERKAVVTSEGGEGKENSCNAAKAQPKTTKKEVKCVMCDLLFENKAQLEDHKLTHTEEERANPYLCKECGKRFKSRCSIRAHHKVHADTPVHPCLSCGKIFKYKAGLRLHIRKKHDATNPWPMHQCKFCPKKFDRKLVLEQHMNCHTGERPFACDKCDKAFHTDANLRQHVACHLDARPYMCDVCGMAFKWPKNLRQHSMTHVCKETRRGYQEYMPVECDQCHKIFKGKRNLKFHKLRLHPEEFQHENPQVKRLRCNLCGQFFTTQTRYDYHMKKYHSDGKLRFVCELCGKGFTTKINKDVHVRLHTGERPFACRLCPKTFASSSNLHAHRDAHTDVRPHVCRFCDKAFKRRAHLAIHLRSHTGEKPYACDICHRSFTQSGERNKHKLTHTTEKAFQCTFCKDKFKRKRDLNEHMSEVCGPERQEERQEVDFSALLDSDQDYVVSYEVC